MNLILLFPQDFISNDEVVLHDGRFIHIHGILQSHIGDTLVVGKLNGLIGQATIVAMSNKEIKLKVIFTQNPPQALGTTLIMPMLRPPVFRRILQHVTALGIKEIYIINSARVEKSLWNSSALKTEDIQEQLVLGLQQAKDTMLPEVHIHRRLKLFVNDQLPGIIQGKQALIAHPHASDQSIPKKLKKVIAIGPEGGWLELEVSQFEEIGFKRFSLGERILRVETAVIKASD